MSEDSAQGVATPRVQLQPTVRSRRNMQLHTMQTMGLRDPTTFWHWVGQERHVKMTSPDFSNAQSSAMKRDVQNHSHEKHEASENFEGLCSSSVRHVPGLNADNNLTTATLAPLSKYPNDEPISQ